MAATLSLPLLSYIYCTKPGPEVPLPFGDELNTHLHLTAIFYKLHFLLSRQVRFRCLCRFPDHYEEDF